MFDSLKRSLSRLLDRPGEDEAAPPGPSAPGRFDNVERLRDKYPALRSIVFNLAIRAPDNAIEPTLNGRSFGPDARAYFVFKCKNVDCIHGDFDLSDVVEDMVANRREIQTGRRVCQGWESSVFVNQRRCLYELNFKAVASYEH